MIGESAPGAGTARTRRPPLAVGAVFSPDNKLALVLYAQPETGRIWDLERGEERRTSLQDIYFGVAALLPDGRSVLSAHHVKYPLHLWDTNDGHLIRTFPDPGFIDVRADGVTELALSADGRLALSAHGDTRLKLWDVGTGKQLRVMGERTAASTNVSVYYLALLPDGQRAMASRGPCDLWLWDVTTGKRVNAFKGPPGNRVLTLSADVQSALYTRRLGLHKEPFPVILWDFPAEKEVARFVGHKDSVSDAAIIPDEARVLSGSNDGVLKCWDIPSQKEVWSFDSGLSFTKYAFSADRKLALIVSEEGALQLVDARQGKLIRKLRGPFKPGESY
jgi:WD40 repeat protein